MARIPIALQLYSVREDCKKDLPGVLEKVAKMGYEGVEFAGYYDYSAQDLIIFDAHGCNMGLYGQSLSVFPAYKALPGAGHAVFQDECDPALVVAQEILMLVHTGKG